jgi:hypothetical protein
MTAIDSTGSRGVTSRTVTRGVKMRFVSRFGMIVLLALFTTIASARANTVTPTATLPVPGSTYTSVAGGALTFGSVISDSFSLSGQNVVSNVTFVDTLPSIGTVTLTGTLGQDLIGRSSSTELGSWTSDIVSLALSGSVLGQTLTVGLNPLQTSSGNTSIVTSGNQFLVNSFFNVYLSASLGSSPTFDLSPFQLTLVASSVSSTPLPDALPLFATGLCALALLGWYRKRYVKLIAR